MFAVLNLISFLALSNPVQPAAFEKAGLYCDTGIPTANPFLYPESNEID